VFASQQVLVYSVLFALRAPVVQANDHGQAEHDSKRHVFGNPADLFHGGIIELPVCGLLPVQFGFGH